MGDALFWLVLTAVVFGMLLLGTSGDVRWYVFVGLAAGALLYRRHFSERGYVFCTGLLRVLRRVQRIVFYPFACLWAVLSWPFRLPVRLLRAIGRHLPRRNKPLPPDRDAEG